MRALYGTDSMPETGENVAEQFQVSRADQDAFALRSQQKAAAAQASGFFAREITPVTIKGRKGDTVVERDEHPRETRLEALGKLKTPFRKAGHGDGGQCERGERRQRGADDRERGGGAAARAGRRAPGWWRWRRRGWSRGSWASGRRRRCGSCWRGTGIKLAEVDVIELNEAFAAQGLAVMRQLGLPDDEPRVNPHGGAIALGHPLGMSGARLALTAVNALEPRGRARAVVTMCIGVGQGIAALIERV